MKTAEEIFSLVVLCRGEREKEMQALKDKRESENLYLGEYDLEIAHLEGYLNACNHILRQIKFV